ncbi:MAG: JAB domain-containing protein [Opitutaceae bacterium]
MQVTRQLREAARAVDIELVDHIILGRPEVDPNRVGHYSFRECGLL